MAKTVSGEDQGDERKRTIDVRCRNIRDGVKTGVLADLQDKFKGNLFTA
ncbi:MAG: hypothetical protein OEV45_12210 [Desulfobacteraceae bacterium]|nr:hypothetical protein [Desulfobacteraceae bacterium]